jgi:CBS domain-containing protein
VTFGGGRKPAAIDRGGIVAQSIREVLTKDPVVLSETTTVTQAARAMRDADIGDVIVVAEGDDQIQGILTDRDIAIRVVADGADPDNVTLDQIATRSIATLTVDASVEDAIRVMKERDIRRIPILDGGRPVGIVSLGDLAVARDTDSLLADISAAEPDQ